MASNDVPRVRLLSRRELVALLGASAACLLGKTVMSSWALAASESQSCIVRPEQTEGPYFVDERLDRSDLRSDPTSGLLRPGTPLALTLLLSRRNADGCAPLAGAQVDLWHCDASGIYSDVRDPHFTTVGQKFLRGYQVTDERGAAGFMTIFPGWYEGRTVHIHLKIRTAPQARRQYEFTSQMYFDDGLADRVFLAQPYAARGPRHARNFDDRIFRRGGDQLMLAPTPMADGYAATFATSLDLP